MLVKIVGSIFILASTTYMGYKKSLKYKLRPTQIRELQACFHMVENEISYLESIITDIFNKIAESNKSIISDIFSRTAEIINAGNVTGAAKAWETSVTEKADTTCLNKEDIEILKSFGKLLGTTDKEGQLSNIALTLHQLKNQEVKAEEEKRKNGMLYTRLGIMAGAAVVIMIF